MIHQLPLRHSPAAGLAAKPLFILLLAPLFAVLLASTGAWAAGNGLSVSHAWIRMIMPSRPAAGYFTLSNTTDKVEILVGAASPACGMVMLHQSVHKNGQEQMIMVKSIAIPAHGSFTFAPGGYHVMCMSPGKTVTPGQSIPITLRFADGTRVMAQFLVRGATGK